MLNTLKNVPISPPKKSPNCEARPGSISNEVLKYVL